MTLSDRARQQASANPPARPSTRQRPTSAALASNPQRVSPSDVLRLQRLAGNGAVQRFFGETEGEKNDTGESPGAVWRWLTWAGIGLADLVAGCVEWFGLEDYDIAADLLRHYMSGRGADYQLEMPAEWAAKIASVYRKPRNYRDVSSYKWGIPDMRNALGHFDLTISANADGGKTYTVTDKYHFPYIPNDKWQKGRHGFQVGFFGALPASVQQNVNAALAGLGTWKNPGGFDERFEVKKIGSEWTLLIPQQFLADSGVDFSLHSEFTVSASGEISTGSGGGWF